MATDRELQNIMSSGENTSLQLNSQAVGDAVPVKDDVAGLTELAMLAKTGLMVMSGNSLTAQSIAITPTKVVLFDTKNVEAGAGAVGDVALNRATATLAGVFKLRFEAFVDYASNVDITWSMYKNGSPFGNTITLSGQGANSFPITLITSAELLANDYLELYATASSVTNLTVSQANGTLEKTIF